MALTIARQPPSANPNIWKACSGTSVEIPAVKSRVYYFPQGHAEQSSGRPVFSSSVFEAPVVHCRIRSVLLLASPETDEVFAKICLQPQPYGFLSQLGSTSGMKKCEDENFLGQREDEIKSFTKILTPSDANNGGGFSVPRDCADTIFPLLNYAKEPPVQTLELTDIHGKTWEFRHIFRGTPRRHLLTTGWSKFVNEKKLVAGDSVVFMKKIYGNLFIGIRRGTRTNRMDSERFYSPNKPSSSGVLTLEEVSDNGDGFYSSSGEKVSADSVVKAAELARAGSPFEIVYYPATSSDFIVKAEIVEESRNIIWMVGMRVKMAVETERPPKVSHYQGTVSSVTIQDPHLWRWSPWRMLEVTWDEPEVMQNRKKVSPWQVELVAPTSTVQTPFSTIQTQFSLVAGLTDSGIRDMRQSLCSYDHLTVGMQGARQDSHCVSDLSNSLCYQHQSDHLYGNEATKASTSLYGNVATKATDDLYGNVTTKSSCVSTDLTLGSTSQYDDSTPNSQSSVHFFGNEHSDNHNCSPAAKSSSTPAISSGKTEKSDVHSFKLFGKIIQTNQPRGDISHRQDPSSTCSSKNISDTLDVPNK